LKILDTIVEKVTEDVPKEENKQMKEIGVISYPCCSFLVRELARLYNKDFKHNAELQSNNHTNSSNNNTSATILNKDEYEVIYFILRILGHVTSIVEYSKSQLHQEEDLRTKLGKEGLLAIVIGIVNGLSLGG
jgi:hypothetical protein